MIFFQKDTFAPKSTAASSEGDGDDDDDDDDEDETDGSTSSNVITEIVDLDWERWGGDRLAIVFRIRSSESTGSGKTEVALYSVTQDNRFGPPPRMAFALLGKVATQEAEGGK